MNQKQLMSIIRSNTMLGDVTLSNIRKQTTYVIDNEIPGDIVECGVWKGGCSAFIAKLLMSRNKEKMLYLFDSFDDPPEPGPEDDLRLISKMGGLNTGRLVAVKGCYKSIGKGGPGDAKSVHALITKTVGYKASKVRVCKGWFQDTLPVECNNITSISMFILDCGMYESNKVCLEYLYDKVSVGGVVIVDNYSTYTGCKKAVDEFFSFGREHPNMVKVNKDCVCWIKR